MVDWEASRKPAGRYLPVIPCHRALTVDSSCGSTFCLDFGPMSPL